MGDFASTGVPCLSWRFMRDIAALRAKGESVSAPAFAISLGC